MEGSLVAYKVFSNGSVLNASEINDNLMNQSVIVFSNSATRDAALTTPLAGMIVFLEDSQRFELYNGATWVLLTIKGNNIGLGSGALNSVTTGNNNTAIGRNALRDVTTGVDNVALGDSSLIAATTSNNSIAIGRAALQVATGDSNVAIGRSAGLAITTGFNNTFLGLNAGNTTTTGSNNTVLGNSANTLAVGTSNSITLGNSSITSLRCNVTTISSLSDERDKTDITDTQFGMNLIQQLRPVDFTWARRDGSYEGMTDVGFISQELIEVEDSFEAADRLRLTLRENPDSLEATPGRLIPVIVKALQELSAENESLKARLEALEK
jgi:hypothetical protein